MSIQNPQPNMLDEKHNRPLQCPGCGSSLKEVCAEANYGRDLLLDQCPDCGGIWFDYSGVFYHKRVEAPQKLGQALSTRVSPGSGESLNLDEAEIDMTELTKDLVFVIIQVLLRLILKI